MDTYVENLLAPLSPASPTGPDMGDSNEMFKIEDFARGTPAKAAVEDGGVETPAEPPDWKKLRKECEAFLTKSKHLKVAVVLTTCLLKQKGLEGFRDGLQVITGYVREYWETFHPLLDPTDGNDPTQRLNLLSPLRLPRWPGEWLLASNHLYEVPLAGSDGSLVTLSSVDLARGRSSTADGSQAGMGTAAITALIRSTPQEQLKATVALLQELVKLVEELDALLTSKVGSGKAESFNNLLEILGRMEGVLSPYIQTASAEEAAEGDAIGAEPGGVDASANPGQKPAGEPNARAEGGSGVIRSREDVVKQLGIICDFLVRTEPSSPIIYLLRRAQRMVGMDFLQVVAELSITTTDPREALKPAMGIGLPEPQATPSTTAS